LFCILQVRTASAVGSCVKVTRVKSVGRNPPGNKHPRKVSPDSRTSSRKKSNRGGRPRQVFYIPQRHASAWMNDSLCGLTSSQRHLHRHQPAACRPGRTSLYAVMQRRQLPQPPRAVSNSLILAHQSLQLALARPVDRIGASLSRPSPPPLATGPDPRKRR